MARITGGPLRRSKREIKTPDYYGRPESSRASSSTAPTKPTNKAVRPSNVAKAQPKTKPSTSVRTPHGKNVARQKSTVRRWETCHDAPWKGADIDKQVFLSNAPDTDYTGPINDPTNTPFLEALVRDLYPNVSEDTLHTSLEEWRTKTVCGISIGDFRVMWILLAQLPPGVRIAYLTNTQDETRVRIPTRDLFKRLRSRFDLSRGASWRSVEKVQPVDEPPPYTAVSRSPVEACLEYDRLKCNLDGWDEAWLADLAEGNFGQGQHVEYKTAKAMRQRIWSTIAYPDHRWYCKPTKLLT